MNAMTRTGKTILNALAFANVNTLSEFRAVLRQIDEPAGLAYVPTPHETISRVSGSSPVAPVIGHIQGAL